jgi:hypothetical protein
MNSDEWPVPRTSPEQWSWPGTEGASFRASLTVDLDAAEAKLRALVEAGDPEIIEDLRSLSESAPFAVRLDDSLGLMPCERCRTMVVSVPEALVADPPESRRWQRAVWEPETGRKHTIRRCEAMQA